MNKMALDDFIARANDNPKWDSVSLTELMDRNFLLQMMDVWGEAEKVIKSFEKSNNDDVIKQLSNFHDVCNIIYLNENIDDNVKWELKVAEWELFDYCLWDNLFHNDSVSVMKWFDQWCYDINYDLL